MPDETLGNWHDATTLRAAWASLPSPATTPGEIGADLIAASKARCIRHLLKEGLPVPADGEVPASHRLAQLYFARSEWATRVTNEDASTTGMVGYEIPAYNFEKKARDELGYASMGIG